jgi:hypothetical protein
MSGDTAAYPEGLRVFVCRRCKLVALSTGRCPVCFAACQTATIFNEPPLDHHEPHAV